MHVMQLKLALNGNKAALDGFKELISIGKFYKPQIQTVYINNCQF